MADDVEHLVGGDRLDERVQRAFDLEAKGGPVGLDRAHAREGREWSGGDGSREVDDEATNGPRLQPGHVLDDDQPPLADDRDAIGDVLHLGEDVRGEEHRAARRRALAHEAVELLLDEGVETARRLVEDEELRPVHQRLDEADLLPVALREVGHGAVQVEVEPLDQLVHVARIDADAQAREEREVLAARQARVEGELARDVADVPADLDALPARVQPEHDGPARRRTDEVDEEPERGRLAGSVRPQVAEDLAALDLEGEVDDAPRPAVALRQALGLDCRRRHGP